MVDFPNVKQGSVNETNKVLAEFAIKTSSTDKKWMIPKITQEKVSLEVRKIEEDLKIL